LVLLHRLLNDILSSLVRFCFGGTGVLLYALENLPNGVTTIVSMHGGLTSIVNDDGSSYDNFTTKANILVLSGGEDDTSTDIISLEQALNSAIASHVNQTSSNTTSVTHGSWEITRFDGIEHAWTVWDSGELLSSFLCSYSDLYN
jgi:dienelactone hydrolase